MLPARLQEAADALRALPQIGPRQSLRLAIFLFRNSTARTTIINALTALGEGDLTCERCYRITDTNPCSLCTDQNRDRSLLMIVEEDTDLEQMESTGAYTGQYFVLGGRFSASRGQAQEQDLRINELRARLNDEKDHLNEVILAISPTLEGETLLMELRRLARDLGIKTSQLGRGLPTGGEIEYADEETLKSAFTHRS